MQLSVHQATGPHHSACPTAPPSWFGQPNSPTQQSHVSHDKVICGVPSTKGTFSHVDLSQQSFLLQLLLKTLQKR